jgi:hypothetical protein
MIVPQIIHRILENLLLPVYAKGVLGHEALSAALLTASNLGELLGASLLLHWSARHPTSSTWVRWGAYGLLGIGALSLVQVLHLPVIAAVAVAAPFILAASLTWASSHLSLESDIQEKVDKTVQPRVISLLFGLYVVGAAGASFLIGRFLDALPLAQGFLWLSVGTVFLSLFIRRASRGVKESPK